MNWKDCYSDICAEIRIMGIREMELRKRVELAHKAMFTGELPSSGSYCHLPLDKGIEQYNAAVSELDAIQDEVDRLNGIKAQMEQHMSQFKGLIHVIEYKRIVEGKTYRQMASELGFSESHLRNTYSKKYKHSTQNTNAS